jgi:hypothetical protein
MISFVVASEAKQSRRLNLHTVEITASPLAPRNDGSGYSGHAPPGKVMIGTIVPTVAAGAWGGRITRQSDEARGRIIEESCTGNGVASSTPSAPRSSRERR